VIKATQENKITHPGNVRSYFLCCYTNIKAVRQILKRSYLQHFGSKCVHAHYNTGAMYNTMERRVLSLFYFSGERVEELFWKRISVFTGLNYGHLLFPELYYLSFLRIITCALAVLFLCF